MGLKVLLADDSSAIKKVVQLCLQDFGVELKSVGSGKDALDLIRQFHPDIALIDVMLPHKPGFDVAMELKADPQFKSLPIIMLWSSFMEFDQAKFAASGAEDKLEKPFEAKDLRELVKKYVPKLQTNPFLSHIEPPKIEITASRIPQAPPEPLGVTSTESEAWSMSSFEDIGKFAEKPMETVSDSDWVRKDLGKFKVDVKDDENFIPLQLPDQPKPQQQAAPIHITTSATAPMPTQTPKPQSPPKTTSPDSLPGFSSTVVTEEVRKILEQQVREIVEKEARAIIEKAIWKIVPDMATELIREEIKRLTDG